MQVEYRATKDLPAGVPAAVVAGRGRLVVLIDQDQSIEQACRALGPLLEAHAEALWTASAAIEVIPA